MSFEVLDCDVEEQARPMTDLDWVLGFSGAAKTVDALAVGVYRENHFAWEKLLRIKDYLDKEAIRMGDAYFGIRRKHGIERGLLIFVAVMLTSVLAFSVLGAVR